ncbi:MAG: ABC transporter permease subunit [Chloroflexi bacterium]|nr:ABC transporter permease subunit [Chloroflexota bacterium]
MQNAWIIARRELGAIFVQPIAYVFMAAMSLITGAIFAQQISFLAQGAQGAPAPNVADSLSTFAFLGVFAIPAITMRLVSEERQSGTVELLMTMPITDGQVILGKFLAALILYIATTALTLIYPLVLLRFGNPDVGPMLTTYLMVVLWGSALISIGIFASTISTNQINAFMLSFAVILILYLLAFLSNNPSLPERVGIIMRELSLLSHQENFFSGVLTVKDTLYFVLVTGVFLFAAARFFESRRWR